MKKTIKRLGLLLIPFLISMPLSAQYLANPSFEGVPMQHFPPSPWDICDFQSTPDTQPGWLNCFGPASEGQTYLLMICRGSYGISNPDSWEDVRCSFTTPLSPDTCYLFSIDLRFDPQVHTDNYPVGDNPVNLKIYGEENVCDKINLLWESGGTTDLEWTTYTFLVQPQFEITELVMEAYYTQLPEYFGHVLVDNIVIEPTPNIELGNDTTVAFCPGGYFPISPGDGYAGYLWQDGYDESEYQVTESGQYWVDVTDGYGCSASDTVNITIENYEELSVESSDEINLCEGQSTDIWVSVEGGLGSYHYLWNQAIEDTVSTINVSPSETTMYIATITDSCGSEIMDTIMVNVLPTPEISLGNDTLLCGGEELVLDAGEGYSSYIWNDLSTDQTLTVTTAGTYWVQVSNTFGCSATATIDVSYAPPIEVGLGNDTVVCVGEVLLLEAIEGMSSYLWQDGSEGSSLEVTESGLYWVMVENDIGCVATDSIEVVFEENQTSVDLGPDTQLCMGDNLVLDPGLYNGYLWQDGSTNPTYTVTQAGEYWVEVLGGCGTATDTIVVGFYPATLPDLGQDTTVCFDELYVLEPGNYYSYLWQDGSNSPNFAVYETGTYSVNVVDNNGCQGSDEVYVRVGQEVSLEPQYSLCEGDTLTIELSTDFDFYIWKNSANDTIGMDYQLEITEGGDYSISVGLNEIVCNSSANTTVVEVPKAVAVLDKKDLCQGESLSLGVEQDDSYSYEWNTGSQNPEIEVSEEGEYWVKVGNSCGDAFDTVYIELFPLPTLSIGEDYTLLEDEQQEVYLDAGEGFVSYEWQDGSSLSTYTASYEAALLDSVFYVKVFDGHCYNTDTVIIEVVNVEVPNILTPNGDGKNDLFLPANNWIGVKEHTMIVFNRWGQKVWESSEFQKGWNGESLLGGRVPDGTYFWVLQYSVGNGLKKILKGSLTVLSTE